MQIDAKCQNVWGEATAIKVSFSFRVDIFLRFIFTVFAVISFTEVQWGRSLFLILGSRNTISVSWLCYLLSHGKKDEMQIKTLFTRNVLQPVALAKDDAVTDTIGYRHILNAALGANRT